MSTPKYQMIVATLCNELAAGLFHPGDVFYSEADIKNRFNVSSTTAVKALNILANDNKITRIQGKGTFVSKENHATPVKYTDLTMAHGQVEDTKVLSITKKNDQKILRLLHLPKSASYFEIKRLRYINQKVIQYTISYLNTAFLDETRLANLQDFASLYQRIHVDFKLNPYLLPYEQETTAQNITIPDVLQHFTPATNLDLIVQNRRTFLPNKQVLDYVVSYKRLEYWGFSIQSTGKN